MNPSIAISAWFLSSDMARIKPINQGSDERIRTKDSSHQNVRQFNDEGFKSEYHQDDAQQDDDSVPTRHFSSL